jgi:RNA polymerase sigma-70 factor (ECF subfamily)
MFAGRPDDAEVNRLAMAARTGDMTATGAFIRATQADVLRFLAHLINQAEAEDLAQETFLRAMRSLPSFEARSSARTWLLAIARRVAADHIRTLTRRPRTAGMDNWTDIADAAQAKDSPRFEETILLWHLVEQLSAERREAFVATQVIGLSYAEAAQVCDCPIGTIRSRVARAREDLAAALAGPGTGTTRHLRAIT